MREGPEAGVSTHLSPYLHFGQISPVAAALAWLTEFLRGMQGSAAILLGLIIGGMMALGNAPQPCWLVYFGVNGINPAIRRITDAGGTVRHGPHEVPGGAHIAVATDPQGAWFALVGPLEETP